MTTRKLPFVFAAILAGLAGCAPSARLAPVSLVYPTAHQVEQVDEYHGFAVADPYRWLEDSDAPKSRDWIDAQNRLTFSYLKSIPARETIRRRMTELWNYEKFRAPTRHGGRYFIQKNDGLQNQYVLYTTRSLDDDLSVLLDPNKLSSDGTVALNGAPSVSHDGRYLAYGTSASGSDWKDWHVRDIETGRDLPDHIAWSKFSDASWDKDSQGFYYSRYDAPEEGAKLQDVNYFQKLYYHKLHTPQSQDVLVYERPDHKDWGFGGEVTDDGRYLVISIWQGTEQNNRVYYKELTSPGAPVVELLDAFDAKYTFIDNDGPVFWFLTDLDAPRGRVVAIDTRRPERAKWKELIAQSDDTLRSVDVVYDSFVAQYLRHAHSAIKVYDLSGRLVREVDLRGIGSAGGFAGKRTDTETFYTFSSYSQPTTVYRYDMTTGKSTVFKTPDVSFDPEDYITKQVFYRSKDGTRVPMSLTYKKGLSQNGNTPTLLYGYGGFDIAITPRFRVSTLVWMEMGGIYAVPNIRGGGEYGKEWHLAGCKLKKQNVFDDFIAAAEWLIANNYTRTEKLAVSGASNGGLLVGACMTQRPDLFGATLPAVGVMDMLRFEQFTIGWAWVSDYGSVKNREEFDALYAYSPLHNIKPNTAYPPTLITTADHDDRVVPAHSFKFAATMQAAQAGDAPILIRIETKAGHGAGKPTDKQIEEQTDKLAFLCKELDIKVE